MTQLNEHVLNQIKQIVINKSKNDALLDYVKSSLGERFEKYIEFIVIYIEQDATITPIGCSPIRKKAAPVPIEFSKYLQYMPAVTFENVLVALNSYLHFSYMNYTNIFKRRIYKLGAPFEPIDKILAPTFSIIFFNEQLEQIFSLLTGASKTEAIQFRIAINHKISDIKNNEHLKTEQANAIQLAESINILPGLTLSDLINKQCWHTLTRTQSAHNAEAFKVYQLLCSPPKKTTHQRSYRKYYTSYKCWENMFDEIKQVVLTRDATDGLVNYVKEQLGASFASYEEHFVLYLEKNGQKIPLQFLSSTGKLIIPEKTFADYLNVHFDEAYSTVLKALCCYMQFDELGQVDSILNYPFKRIGAPYEIIDTILEDTNGYILYKDQLVQIYMLLTGHNQATALNFCKLHNRKSHEAISQAKKIYIKPKFSLDMLLAWRCWDKNQFVYNAPYHAAWIIHCHLHQLKTNASWSFTKKTNFEKIVKK